MSLRPSQAALASFLCALLLAIAQAGHAQTPVTARELLGWCEGALGGAVTAEFDAFRCTTYLRAMLDQQRAAGRDLTTCLGGREPDAADLMARLVPDLRARAVSDPDSLSAPASTTVSRWIIDQCPGDPASEDSADDNGLSEPEPDRAAAGPLPALDPAAIEFEIWRSTQRIESEAQRRQALQHYLDAYPDGRFARLARLQLDDLDAAAPAGPDSDGPSTAPPDAEVADDEVAGPDQAPAQDPPLPERPGSGSVVAPEVPEDTPPDDPVAILSRGERIDVQGSLQALGYYRLAIDGIVGPGTRAAIRGFQRDLGRSDTGQLTEYERDKLFELSPPPPRPTPSPTPTDPGPTDLGPQVEDEPALPDLYLSRPAFVARNFGNSAVVAVFASPVESRSWEHNRISGRILLPGEEFLIPLFDHPGRCLFDIRFVDEFRFEREYRRIDVCRAEFVGFP